MNTNETNISNDLRARANTNTSRVFSGKMPQIQLEGLKSFENNPLHSRQKSASHQQFIVKNAQNEDFPHCNRIKIRELYSNEMQNECRINCSNLEKIKYLENQIKDLLEGNLNLKKINEYLIKSLSRKEELFLDVTNENKNLKFDNHLLNSHIGSRNAFSRERVCSSEKIKRQNNLIFNTKINFNSIDNSEINNLKKNRFKNVYNIKDFNKIKYLIEVGNNQNKSNTTSKNENSNEKNNENKKVTKKTKNNIFNLTNEETYGNFNSKNNKENKFLNASQINKNSNLNNNRSTFDLTNFNIRNLASARENINDILKTNIPIIDSNLGSIEFTHLNEKIKNISSIKIKEKAEAEEITAENSKNASNKDSNCINSKAENALHHVNKGFLSARNDALYCKSLISPVSFANGNPKKTQIQTHNQKQKNYYERISGIMRKARIENHSKTKEENLVSFLSLEKNNIEKFFKNRMFRKIKKLIYSESEFFEKLKSYDEEKLSGYCEMISSVSDNLQNAVNLILKLKTIFESFLFKPKIDSKQTLCAYFINLVAEILECEKVLVYKIDDFSNDKLIIYAGKEKDLLNDFRINKGFGIIGQVLEKGEAMRIDDAAFDPLFIKDRNNEHLNGLKIKNLIYAPVKIFVDKEDENKNDSNNNFGYNNNNNIRGNSKAFNNNFNNSIGIVNGAGAVSVKKTAANASNLLKTINSEKLNNKAFDTIKSNKAEKTDSNQSSNINNSNSNNLKNNNSNNPNKKFILNNCQIENSNSENYKSIAVLQAINKKKGNFSNDDLELFIILSGFFSFIWQNLSDREFNSQNISKLKAFCEFSSERKFINSKADITAAFEPLLISMFSGNCAQLLFFDCEKDELRRISKYENKIKNKNQGIIGYVLEKKEYYGCASIINCLHFSSAIDFETSCNLLSYPLFCKQRLVAVLQFGYNGKLSELRKPAACDEVLIGNVIKAIVGWICSVSENDILEKDNK